MVRLGLRNHKKKKKKMVENGTSNECDGAGGKPEQERGLPVPAASLPTLALPVCAFSGPRQLDALHQSETMTSLKMRRETEARFRDQYFDWCTRR